MKTPTVYRVSNGVTLRTLSTDRFKAGMLSISAILPISRELTPMTSLLLSVLRRGTEKYPTLADLNRRLDHLYGTGLSIRNFYRGDCQIIGFSAELLDGAYLPDREDLIEGVLELAEQILFHPCLENGLLQKKYVESEKQLQCDAIRAQKNNPRSYASGRCRMLLLENEPAGVPLYGTEEEIDAITPERLTAHWKDLLKKLSFDCFYVGGTDPETICRVLKSHLASHACPVELSAIYSKPSLSARVPRQYKEELSVSQGQLLLAWRTDIGLTDRAFHAITVMNELFGLSPVSRLFVNLRERLSLCYFCSSSYNAFKGTLTVHCGLDPANREAAQREILKQLSAIQQGEFSERELEAAKHSVCNAYRQLEDSPAAMENFYFGRALLKNDLSVEECLHAFQAVDREAVIRSAEQIRLDTIYFLNGTLVGEGGFDDGGYNEYDD